MTNKLIHHHLSAELVTDKHGTGLMLSQQEGIEDADTLFVHPWQLRAVCEQFGIIAPDATSAKTIATLQRRMAGLRDRIDAMADWMAKYSDHAHADLSHEVTQVNALADLAGEWCSDFESVSEVDPATDSGMKPIAQPQAPATQAPLL